MNHRLRIEKLGLFAVLVASLSLGACDDGDDGDDGAADGGTAGGMMVSHAEEIQPIWDRSCVAGCHEAGGSASYLDLSEGMAYAELVDVDSVGASALKLVVPGDPDSSFLYLKITGDLDGVDGTVGLQMPLTPDFTGSDPLPQAEQDLIRDWIASGAAM